MDVSPTRKSQSADTGERVARHHLLDRLYHWLMAVATLVLMASAFLPILGVKFQWLEMHWMSGVLLAVLIAIHGVRAVLWQDWRAMMIGVDDGRELCRSFARALGFGGASPALPGKYDAAQKFYHLGMAALVLAVIASGLLMLLKIDTPFWRRDPYWFSGATWGIIYVVHGLAAMAMVTMLMIHVYFALRPDEWYLTRSMLRGWITRKEYSEHHDAARWKA
ncbi:MAG: cytochrome b/b6 domain-containing protein [Proteobacteria bacterium]|nr:cytochrome b/b6 domain-containing protein [Pseudomonadota bacterium]